MRKNAKTYVDNFGMVFKASRSGRVLSILNPMTGEWDGPQACDGLVTRRGSPYLYHTSAKTETVIYGMDGRKQ